jgi:hypothetical protein
MGYPEKDKYKQTQSGIILSVILNHEVHEVEFNKPPLKCNECSLRHCENHASLQAKKWRNV